MNIDEWSAVRAMSDSDREAFKLKLREAIEEKQRELRESVDECERQYREALRDIKVLSWAKH